MRRGWVVWAFTALLCTLVVTGTAHAGDTGNPCVATLSHRCVVQVTSGEELAYLADGPRGGPVILLLHGLTNSADAWTPTMQALHRRLPDARIIALDLRGHGRSSLPVGKRCFVDPGSCFAMPVMAGDVLDFMTLAGIEQATLVGHSMGSLVAQQVALTAPARVARLVLIGTTSDARVSPILDDWLLQTIVNGNWRNALEAQGIAWPQPALLSTVADAQPDALTWLRTYWNVYPVSSASTAAVAQATARLALMTWLGATAAIIAYDATDQLRRLAVPTLVLWGTQDVFFGKDQQRLLVASLSTSAQHGGGFCWKQYGERPLAADGLQHDDLGHNLTWEAPREVATDIASFIRHGRPTTARFTAGAGGVVLTDGSESVLCRGRTHPTS